MNWFFPKNDTSKRVVIIPVRDSGREVQGVELRIGHQDKMMEDCEKLSMTNKEWTELKRKINEVFN